MIGGLGFFPVGAGAPLQNPFFFHQLMAQKESAKILMAATAVGMLLLSGASQSEETTVHAYVDGKPVKSHVMK